jgi:hypothetical protein
LDDGIDDTFVSSVGSWLNDQSCQGSPVRWSRK